MFKLLSLAASAASFVLFAALTGCNYGLVDHDSAQVDEGTEPAPADDGSVDVTEVPDTGSTGSQDTGTAAVTIKCWWDADSDKFGNINVPGTFEGTECPVGYADNGDDCDEGNAAINPDADEVCGDGVDNDCVDGDEVCAEDTGGDTGTDDTGGDGVDADEDGYDVDEDCDDTRASVNPGAAEVDDDLIDNDCNGLVDLYECWWDADDDGYGNGSMPTYSREGGCGTNWADNGSDWCEDDASAHTESDCE